jgi:hypothetical protein
MLPRSRQQASHWRRVNTSRLSAETKTVLAANRTGIFVDDSGFALSRDGLIEVLPDVSWRRLAFGGVG